MEPNPQDQEAARTRRTYLLLAAVALLLVIPLVVVAYLRMSDTTTSGTPGANLMSVFEKREGRGPVLPSPIMSAAPMAKQDSLVKPVGEIFSQESSTAPAQNSLGMITGMPATPPPQQTPAQVQPQPQPEPEVDLQAVMPKAATAKAPRTAKKSSWAPPKLGTRQSGLKTPSWATDSRKGSPGAGTTAPQMPAGAPGADGGAPPGMPPGMDPAAMMKNMMPGMDMSKMMQGAMPGTTNPAAGTTNPTGTK
ncbi:MAG: hypothetical protein HZB91_13115 [Elusimicrobia bacterium]|nr:hypothetical protein [Elusimicrobiota bacterium]